MGGLKPAPQRATRPPCLCRIPAYRWRGPALQDVDAPVFWRAFQHSVSVLCIGELKEALLGLSCLGCRGLMPLFANLSSSFSNEQIKLLKQRAPPQLQVHWPAREPAGCMRLRCCRPRPPQSCLPRSLPASINPYMPQLAACLPCCLLTLLPALPLQEYVEGMDNEIYELRCFPGHLQGRTFREAVLDLARSDVLLLGLGLVQDTGGMAFALAPLDEVGACPLRS